MTFNSEAEDRALSPVIGVILLVGITVILVAVVGGLVTDFGSDVAVTPNAQLSTNLSDGSNTTALTHESGDDLNPENVEIELGGNTTKLSGQNDAPEGLLQAGDTMNIDADAIKNGSSLSSGDEFRLIWIGENGDQNEVILDEIVP